MNATNEPIKILRGNDLTLCLTCFETDPDGVNTPLKLAEYSLTVIIYSARRGNRYLDYKIAGENTIAMDCDASIFDESGDYTLDVSMKHLENNKKIRFASKASVVIVDYIEDLGQSCGGGGLANMPTVINFPPQVACGGLVNFSQFVVPGGIVTEAELDALVYKHTEEYLKHFSETNYWFKPEAATPTQLIKNSTIIPTNL